MAGRTDEEIQIVFDRYKAALYRLYNRELRKDPTLRGQIDAQLTAAVAEVPPTATPVSVVTDLSASMEGAGERHYNNLAGLREGSDTLPKRFLEEPSTLAGSKGHVSELGPMLEEYYAARGWESGVVPESKLKELGIP